MLRRTLLLSGLGALVARPAHASQDAYWIMFEAGEVEPMPHSHNFIAEAIPYFNNASTPLRITVTGHTDTAGDADYNMDLSLRRAERVRDYLVAGGLRLPVIVQGRGELDLARATEDGVSERLNRRVLIEWRRAPAA